MFRVSVARHLGARETRAGFDPDRWRHDQLVKAREARARFDPDSWRHDQLVNVRLVWPFEFCI